MNLAQYSLKFYLLGRASELGFSERLMTRYPKLQDLRKLREENSFFLSFLFRAVGILPCDVVSMYFGSIKMSYLPYISGAVLGFTPHLICATVMGQQVEDYHQPAFWIAVAIYAAVSLSAILFYRWYRKKKNI